MLPKYRQLAGQLRDEITAGGSEGGRLLSERRLALAHKVSRQTVRQALALLAEEGIIEKRRGSGSYAVSGNGENRSRIAFLMPGEESYFPEAVVQEIESVCRKRRYTAQFCLTGGKLAREREILQQLCRDPAGGICVAGIRTALPNPNLDLYRYLKSAGTAIVFAGSPYRGLEDTLFVSMDNIAGGHLAVRHLMSRGHTRIACVFESRDMQDLERYGGCVSAVRDYGLEMQEDCYLWLSGQESGICVPGGLPAGQSGRPEDPGARVSGQGPEMFRDKAGAPEEFWIRAAKRIRTACSAAVCRDAKTARMLAAALRTFGTDVPEDFEILCFRDDSGPENAEPLFPSLVCAGQHPARVAADCLLRMLSGKTVSPVRLSWRLEPAARSAGETAAIP